MFWFILAAAVIAAVYGLGMVASIVGYFFLFLGLLIAGVIALVVTAAALSGR